MYSKRVKLSLLSCVLSMIMAIVLCVIAIDVPEIMLTGFLVFVLGLLQFLRIMKKSDGR